MSAVNANVLRGSLMNLFFPLPQVKVFAKHGFRVKGTKNIGSYQGGFPLFSMVREPRP